jgi:hypothetical protein
LGVGVIHLIERTEVVSVERSVTICIAVRRADIVGKMIQEHRDRVRERYREYETVNARRMLETSLRLRYVVIANNIKVFKF